MAWIRAARLSVPAAARSRALRGLAYDSNGRG